MNWLSCDSVDHTSPIWDGSSSPNLKTAWNPTRRATAQPVRRKLLRWDLNRAVIQVITSNEGFKNNIRLSTQFVLWFRVICGWLFVISVWFLWFLCDFWVMLCVFLCDVMWFCLILCDFSLIFAWWLCDFVPSPCSFKTKKWHKLQRLQRSDSVRYPPSLLQLNKDVSILHHFGNVHELLILGPKILDMAAAESANRLTILMSENILKQHIQTNPLDRTHCPPLCWATCESVLLIDDCSCNAILLQHATV